MIFLQKLIILLLDEEKIRKILRELREKNVNMEQNISKLENTLQDPTFQNITGKVRF